MDLASLDLGVLHVNQVDVVLQFIELVPQIIAIVVHERQKLGTFVLSFLSVGLGSRSGLVPRARAIPALTHLCSAHPERSRLLRYTELLLVLGLWALL